MDQIRPLGTESTCSFVYTWRAAHIEAFRKAGFQNVAYLPLATDTHRCFPTQGSVEEKSKYGSSVSFVGASLVDQGPHYRDVFLSSRAVEWKNRRRRTASCSDARTSARLVLILGTKAAKKMVSRIFPMQWKEHRFHYHHFLESGVRRSKEEPTLLRYSQKTSRFGGIEDGEECQTIEEQAGHLREVAHLST